MPFVFDTAVTLRATTSKECNRKSFAVRTSDLSKASSRPDGELRDQSLRTSACKDVLQHRLPPAQRDGGRPLTIFKSRGVGHLNIGTSQLSEVDKLASRL